MHFFGKKKKKNLDPKYVDVITYESFSAMYFPTGKLEEGYMPEHAAKLEAIRERLRIERDERLKREAQAAAAKAEADAKAEAAAKAQESTKSPSKEK